MDYHKTYSETFKNSDYASLGHNDPKFNYILNKIEEKEITSIIDVGSGRGSLIELIKDKFLNVKLLSIDLDKFSQINVDFMKVDLSNDNDRKNLYEIEKHELLTCLDVLEHLDKSFINEVLSLFSNISDRCIFTIANHSDVWNGVELHTIQEDFSYWEPILLKYFKIVHYEEMYIENNKPRLYFLELVSIKSI